MADDTMATIDPTGLGVGAMAGAVGPVMATPPYPPVNPMAPAPALAPATATAPSAALAPEVVTIDVGAPAPAPAAAPVDPDVVVVDAPHADSQLPDGAALQPDGSVILTLRYPVLMRWKASDTDRVTEESRSQFRFYRLTGADMKVMLNSGSSNNVVLGLARSCRMQVGVFDKLFERMDGSDARAAAEVLGFFFGAGTPTPSGPPASR